MATVEVSSAQVGLKALAERHLQDAVDRLSKLVQHEDPRIALQASALVIQLARPHSPGVTLGIPDFGDDGVPSWSPPVGFGGFPGGWRYPFGGWGELIGDLRRAG